nr:hypothetical protein [Tanacetum cinerariifolium]
MNSSGAACIPKKLASTIGIVVDHRHRNRSLEGGLPLLFNKAGDSTPEELVTTTQVQGPLLSILRVKPSTKLVKVTEEMKSFNAFAKIRLKRSNKRHQAEDQSSGSEKVISVAKVEPLVKDFASKWKEAIELITRRECLNTESERSMLMKSIRTCLLLAVPPSGFVEEELQRKAWKKFLAFEKENPQRI